MKVNFNNIIGKIQSKIKLKFFKQKYIEAAVSTIKKAHPEYDEEDIICCAIFGSWGYDFIIIKYC